MFVSIYALLDPRNGKVCYVGKTQQLPKDRLYRHIAAARQGRTTDCARWIRALLSRGHRPVLLVFEQTDQEHGPEREQFWIADAIFHGAKLTNMTKGGYGSLGYTHSEAARRKIREARSRQTFSPEYREAKSRQMIGNQRAVGGRGNTINHPRTEEWRRRQSMKMKQVRSERFWPSRPTN